MRLHLTLTPSEDIVGYNHLHQLIGVLHKWIGPDNALHDGPSLYSFGWLEGARAQNGGLTFPGGARWRLSFYDEAAARQVQEGILSSPSVCAGMRVAQAERQATPSFSDRFLFKVDAPVVARRYREDGSREYLTYADEAARASLTQTLRRKMEVAGIEGRDSARVRFDRGYEGARTKLATIEKNGTPVQHKASLCPVIVEGSPEAVRFAWNVGVGELTGSGFGALR